MTDQDTILHATTVAVDGYGVLIIGASGTGKSGLAVQLIALGASLIADDRTCVTRDGDAVLASAPETIAGLIEARGVGIIPVQHTAQALLHLVVDLNQSEIKRLPEHHSHEVLGVTLPCLHKIDTAYFASAIMLYIKAKQGV